MAGTQDLEQLVEEVMSDEQDFGSIHEAQPDLHRYLQSKSVAELVKYAEGLFIAVLFIEATGTMSNRRMWLERLILMFVSIESGLMEHERSVLESMSDHNLEILCSTCDGEETTSKSEKIQNFLRQTECSTKKFATIASRKLANMFLRILSPADTVVKRLALLVGIEQSEIDAKDDHRLQPSVDRRPQHTLLEAIEERLTVAKCGTKDCQQPAAGGKLCKECEEKEKQAERDRQSAEEQRQKRIERDEMMRELQEKADREMKERLEKADKEMQEEMKKVEEMKESLDKQMKDLHKEKEEQRKQKEEDKKVMKKLREVQDRQANAIAKHESELDMVKAEGARQLERLNAELSSVRAQARRSLPAPPRCQVEPKPAQYAVVKFVQPCQQVQFEPVQSFNQILQVACNAAPMMDFVGTAPVSFVCCDD